MIYLLLTFLISLALSESCPAMTSISAEQLTCVFPNLNAASAGAYATYMSKLMGSAIGTNTACQWAAMLGNMGAASSALSQWSETSCNSPFCARGPLALKTRSNYEFCSTASQCAACSEIVAQPTLVSSDPVVGFSTAACAWAALSGENLSVHADGSQAGFEKTSRLASCGSVNCAEPKDMEARLDFWVRANKCLNVPEGESYTSAAYAAYAAGYAASTGDSVAAASNGYTQQSSNGYNGYNQQSSNGYNGYNQQSSNGYSDSSSSNGYAQSSSSSSSGYSQSSSSSSSSSSSGYSQSSSSSSGYSQSSNGYQNSYSTYSSYSSNSGYQNSYSTGYNNNNNNNNNNYNSYNSNTGYQNSNNQNSYNSNSGYQNSYNSGNQNSYNSNSGYQNSYNSGYSYSGVAAPAK